MGFPDAAAPATPNELPGVTPVVINVPVPPNPTAVVGAETPLVPRSPVVVVVALLDELPNNPAVDLPKKFVVAVLAGVVPNRFPGVVVVFPKKLPVLVVVTVVVPNRLPVPLEEDVPNKPVAGVAEPNKPVDGAEVATEAVGVPKRFAPVVDVVVVEVLNNGC